MYIISPKTRRHPLLIKPPKPLSRRPIPQLLRRHIPHIKLIPSPDISPPIIHHHPTPQRHRQQKPHPPKRRRRRQRGDILGRVLVLEDIRTDDPHQIGERHAQRREDQPPAFVRDVVVVPDIQEHRRCRRAPTHPRQRLRQPPMATRYSNNLQIGEIKHTKSS